MGKGRFLFSCCSSYPEGDEERAWLSQAGYGHLINRIEGKLIGQRSGRGEERDVTAYRHLVNRIKGKLKLRSQGSVEHGEERDETGYQTSYQLH